MPRPAPVKVQSATRNTRWTLAQNHEQVLYSPKLEELVTAATVAMPRDPYYDQDEPPLPRYESYDGSQYSLPALDVTNSGTWRPPQAVNVNVNGHGHGHGAYEQYDDHDTPLEERAGHSISLNTRMRQENQDLVGQHFLYESAMLDTQSYEILDMAEVDSLKKELARLDAKLEAANRKLVLESKVKDAAQNLQRLYSINDKQRPDTPQSPDSPKRARSSLLGSRGRTSSSGSSSMQPLGQAKDELAMSIRRVDELNEAIKQLFARRQEVERKLLRHTAAVLAQQSAKVAEQKPQINGHALGRAHRESTQSRRSSIYSPDEFDGIRDILHGAPAGAAGKKGKLGNVQELEDKHAQQMASVQSRLEHLNDQLRHIISEACRAYGVTLDPEQQLVDFDEDVSARLDKRVERLESNIQLMEQEQEDARRHYKRLQDSEHMTRNAVEEQLEAVNQHAHHVLLLGSDMLEMETIHEPPQATGHGYQQQLQYMQESLQSMERLLQQQRTELMSAKDASDGASRSIEDAHAKASTHSQKVDEYEATLGGLWEILQSDVAASKRPSTIGSDIVDDEKGLRSPGTPMREDFSLQAFSARVQHLFSRAQSAKEQQEILKRQVQQQRELNGKSDAEKDRQIADLQGSHDHLTTEHRNLQEELTKTMAQHQQAETLAASREMELYNVSNEIEGFKKTIDTRQQEHIQAREEMSKHLQSNQNHAKELQERIEELEEQLSEMTDELRIAGAEVDAKHVDLNKQLETSTADKAAAEQRHTDLQKEMENLESEFVRLSMELTEAKAALDGASGSRSERAKEAQAVEVAGLNEQIAQIQSDHASLTSSHEDLSSKHNAVLAEMETLRAQAATAVSPDRLRNLEAELHDMTDAFQELTKESIALEKERGGLEDLIDGLRDRVEALEAQLTDEKVRWLGLKSPSVLSDAGGGGRGSREMTSTVVLRNEFKRMMREARAEGVKHLRVEQDRNRQLTAELRELRQAGGPLAGASKAQTNGIGGVAAS